GLLTAPVDVGQPVMAPGERMALLVVPDGEAGTELVVKWIAFDRGYGSTFNRPPEDLFAVQLEGARGETPPLPAIQRAITPLSPAGATPITLTLTYQSDPFQLGINGIPYKDAEPLMA